MLKKYSNLPKTFLLAVLINSLVILTVVAAIALFLVGALRGRNFNLSADYLYPLSLLLLSGLASSIVGLRQLRSHLTNNTEEESMDHMKTMISICEGGRSIGYAVLIFIGLGVLALLSVFL